MKLRVINGPNLNMTGLREPSVYGSETLEDINNELRAFAQERGIILDFFQSNSEGELIGAVHGVLLEGYDGCVMNAGAYTHYSYALRDAIAATGKPFVRCISPISMRVRRFATRPSSRRCASARSRALASLATGWRLKRWMNMRKREWAPGNRILEW